MDARDESINKLIIACQDQDAESRWRALDQIRDLMPFEAAMGIYATALNDEHWRVKGVAFHAIQDFIHDHLMSGEAIGPDMIDRLKELLPSVVKALTTDQAVANRISAANVLGLLPSIAVMALGDLIEALSDEEKLYPTAFEGLSDEEAGTRVCTEAAWALGEIGPDAISATSALQAMSQHSDPMVSEAAANALRRIHSSG